MESRMDGYFPTPGEAEKPAAPNIVQVDPDGIADAGFLHERVLSFSDLNENMGRVGFHR